jgi:DNA ligase (NAD+)
VLAGTFGSLERIAATSEEELSSIHEIGPRVSRSVHDFFRQDGNLRTITELLEGGVTPVAEERSAPPGVLAGKGFVFTGTLAGLSREEARETVERLGGRVLSTVNGKVSYLVAGDKPGSKLSRAEKLGVPVLTEDDFLSLAKGEVK